MTLKDFAPKNNVICDQCETEHYGPDVFRIWFLCEAIFDCTECGCSFTVEYLPDEDIIPAMYVFWQDPGHGWLEVPKAAIEKLKIENEISGYSYRQGDRVFLEEDCDAPLYAKAVLESCGVEIKTNTLYQENIFIRNLERYTL